MKYSTNLVIQLFCLLQLVKFKGKDNVSCYSCNAHNLIFFLLNFFLQFLMMLCRKLGGKKRLPHEVVYILILDFLITISEHPTEVFFSFQLVLFLRRKTGLHSSPSFIMTLPMKYRFICRSCNMLHLQPCWVCKILLI